MGVAISSTSKPQDLGAIERYEYELIPGSRINDKLEEFFKASGLKVARQNFEYKSAGEVYSGQNIYAILHAPRGDATEAIVLVGAWKNVEGVLNLSGVALMLTLARYFKSTPRTSRYGGLHANERQDGPFGRRTLYLLSRQIAKLDRKLGLMPITTRTNLLLFSPCR